MEAALRRRDSGMIGIGMFLMTAGVAGLGDDGPPNADSPHFAADKVVLCFRHIGPQDKPLPTICLSVSEIEPEACAKALGRQPAAFRPYVLPKSTIEAFLNCLAKNERWRQPDRPRSVSFGDYELVGWEGNRQSRTHFDASAMRALCRDWAEICGQAKDDPECQKLLKELAGLRKRLGGD